MFVSYGCTSEYSSNIEVHLSKCPNVRYDQIQRIAFNLTLNHSYLTRTYKPIELLSLNDDMLAEQSHIEVDKKKMQDKHQSYHKLTQENFLQREGLQERQCIICRFCGQQSIEFTTKQTRSADEGSTVFFMCTNSKCKKRWKM
jgi:DNA-directed RNA polymerase subunit M/transcription elongation factor TFIIS